MKAIQIDGLAKTYRGKRGASVDALIGLDLDVVPGEVFGFLGPNGAGKSTTIKVLTNQIRATGGKAALFGCPVDKPEARKNVGYLPENPSFFQFMTALEYLHFAGQIHGMAAADIRREAERVLSLLELQHAAKRPIKGYSKGMVQRLALAQAMLHDPDLYILDEPMSGLDPLGRALVKEIILDLKQRGKTVFFSTHITSDVEEVCDRLAVLVKGELKALSRVSDILHSDVLSYRIKGKSKQGVEETFQVSKKDLKRSLDSLLADDFAVDMIDPAKQSLESYFLSIVNGAKSENL